MALKLKPLPQWYCCRCSRALQTNATDQLCHRCLDRTWEALARELTSPWGMSYGRSLPHVVAKPRRGPDNGWRRRPVEVDAEEDGPDASLD
jgi:hypothetical protein